MKTALILTCAIWVLVAVGSTGCKSSPPTAGKAVTGSAVQPVVAERRAVFGKLIWSDEFDGQTLDPAKWQHETGTGVDFYPFMDGWGNDELQYYAEENATVADGVLKITARHLESPRDGKHYTSAKIVTKDKFAFKYGRVEARMKLPYGDEGLWPAFWMLGTNVGKGPEEKPWAQCGEIDIMEMGGRTPHTVHCSMHYRAWPKNTYETQNTTYTGDGFHVFRLDWTENHMKGYIDDTLVHHFKIDNDDKKEAFQHEFYLLLNLAIGGRFAHSGAPNPANYRDGISMEVDWVRVYQ